MNRWWREPSLSSDRMRLTVPVTSIMTPKDRLVTVKEGAGRDEVIAKLKRYEALGVDEFIYYASMGLGQKEQKRSLELFCSEVMPAFA